MLCSVLSCFVVDLFVCCLFVCVFVCCCCCFLWGVVFVSVCLCASFCLDGICLCPPPSVWCCCALRALIRVASCLFCLGVIVFVPHPWFCVCVVALRFLFRFVDACLFVAVFVVVVLL